VQGLDDIDVEYLERGRDEDSPPPMSLAMRLMAKGGEKKSMLKGLLPHKDIKSILDKPVSVLLTPHDERPPHPQGYRAQPGPLLLSQP
jgi:hypothetical protein